MILRILLPFALLWGGAYLFCEVLPDNWYEQWYGVPFFLTAFVAFVASFAPFICAVGSSGPDCD